MNPFEYGIVKDQIGNVFLVQITDLTSQRLLELFKMVILTKF